MSRDRLAQLAKMDAHDAIVEVAVRQFAKRGFDRTSLENIAHELGVTKGALYYHFRKKTDLLLVIHEVFIEELLRKARAREGSDLSPVDELTCVFRDILWLMENMQNHVRVFFEEWRALDEEQAVQMRNRRDAYEDYVQATYERGVASGVFRDLPAPMPVFALFGMVNWSYQWYKAGGQLRHDEVASTLSDIYFNGVLTVDSRASGQQW